MPFSSVPNNSVCCDSARCSIVVISKRSVMMSYSSTPFFFAVAKSASSCVKFSGLITIGLSASTLKPASIDFVMYSVLRALLPEMTTTRRSPHHASDCWLLMTDVRDSSARSR